jgi:regulatory protein
LKKKPDQEGDTPSDEDELCAQIRERALGLLSRREHSTLELKRKLLQRGYPRDLAAPVVEALRAEGLLSESRFAEEWTRSRISRGQGPLKIRAGLRQQGLDDAQIEQVLASDATDWGRLAGEVRSKRFGMQLPQSLAERSRQTRFLESRGFTAEAIRQALGPEQD